MIREILLDLLARTRALFWSHADEAGACWEWRGKRDQDGYGRFSLSIPGADRQLHVAASRWAFALRHGRLPNGVIRHRCDNPACVRPDHLDEGTVAQNRADTVRRGREPRGESKPNSVLTVEIVREARAVHARGVRGELAELARTRGVKLATLHQAATGRTWAHVR